MNVLSFVKRARRVWSGVAQLRMQSGQCGALVGGVQEVLHSLTLGGSRRLSVSLHWSQSARRASNPTRKGGQHGVGCRVVGARVRRGEAVESRSGGLWAGLHAPAGRAECGRGVGASPLTGVVGARDVGMAVAGRTRLLCTSAPVPPHCPSQSSVLYQRMHAAAYISAPGWPYRRDAECYDMHRSLPRTDTAPPTAS